MKRDISSLLHLGNFHVKFCNFPKQFSRQIYRTYNDLIIKERARNTFFNKTRNFVVKWYNLFSKYPTSFILRAIIFHRIPFFFGCQFTGNDDYILLKLRSKSIPEIFKMNTCQICCTIANLIFISLFFLLLLLLP